MQRLVKNDVLGMCCGYPTSEKQRLHYYALFHSSVLLQLNQTLFYLWLSRYVLWGLREALLPVAVMR